MQTLLKSYNNLFAKDNSDIRSINVVEHELNVGNAIPIKEPLRCLPFHATETVDKHVEDMLRDGMIEPSTRPWGAEIVLVRKKDGSTRFCVDCRKLNMLTIQDDYPLPCTDESLGNLFGNKRFSTLDLFSGYWQVSVKPEERSKTALVTRKGFYQFKNMHFVLSCAIQRSNDLGKSHDRSPKGHMPHLLRRCNNCRQNVQGYDKKP